MEAHSVLQQAEVSEKPTGPVAAALLATGIGSLVLGALTTLSEASTSFGTSIAFSDKVGPLSGKTTIAVVAYLASWVVLNGALRKKSVDLRAVTTVFVVLMVVALILTFPTFFELFAPEK